MTERLRAAWDGFWFRPATPLGLVAARALLSAQALWIVLSRPDLAEVVAWPAEFWTGVGPLRAARYLVFGLPAPVERAMYLALPALLAASLVGLCSRLSCAASALLLYHFAPFEEILIRTPGLHFRGLTLPILGLFVLAMARTPQLRDEPSPEYRWPLALVQLLFSLNYFFAFLGKLHESGPGWFSAENMRQFALFAQSWEVPAPWAAAVAASVPLSAAIAAGTLVVEAGFPLVLFSRTAARILVPLAALGHVGIMRTLGIFFPSLLLLLLYLDWDALARRGARRSQASSRSQSR